MRMRAKQVPFLQGPSEPLMGTVHHAPERGGICSVSQTPFLPEHVFTFLELG